MIEHDEHAAPDEQAPGDEPHTPSGDAQATPEPNVEREEPLGDDAATSEEAGTAGDPATTEEPEAVDPATDTLRESLGSMREEADRIATLGTGEEQVEASEKFAEDAGTLDEQIGAASRAHDAGD